jgi:hypothetical protein
VALRRGPVPREPGSGLPSDLSFARAYALKITFDAGSSHWFAS